MLVLLHLRFSLSLTYREIRKKTKLCSRNMANCWYTILILYLFSSSNLSKASIQEDPSSSNEAIISRFQQYLQINTAQPTPHYHEAADFILSQAKALSLESQTLEFVKSKPVILLKWAGSDPSLPSILLNSHTDVVPAEHEKWSHHPFSAHLDSQGNIYARGSQDMKCVGMQYLEAIRRLKASGFRPLRSVYLSFVPDEEIGGRDGALKFAESEVFESLNVGIVLDEGLASPHENYRAFYAERSPWWMVIKAVGAPGHGAKLYDNTAMENLLKSLESVRRFRASQFDLVKAGLKGEGEVISVNMAFLKAGTPSPTGFVMNLQPSEAEAGFDIRIPPTADSESLERRIAEEWAPASRNMTFRLGQFIQKVSVQKMQGASGREEKILVLVRLRPLNEKEIASNEVADWECINDTTILYRNTLREGSTFPNAYSFDRVFRGDCSTRQVYEEGAKEIAVSVVSGINASIFAYGQTSSGKTYTMNGITEYTVAEIFDYIHRHEERAFVVKFSAIEIYNEAVRDLLSTDNTPLRLLDDPDRGTIVEKLTEETLRDWSHLKELLSICEAQRQIGETSLNEKSSRSHQIIRLGIESSAREFLGKDKSTTLAASVSFVDLAGSERASQASSAGTRLKEGCHINRSLLTLGTVIRKLSKGRQGHINYRDSKLTRILQPSLGGNARTAIICTLSPARSHVEQTRNTLLFACCAKEVTTKAQVNVVMSDKALVKHLQKELARLESELRTPAPASASSACDYVALLRKKDLQIEKMDKEIRELTKQRDLAQSRVQDLLQMVGNDQDSRQDKDDHPKLQKGDTWEDELSESSNLADPSSNRVRRYSNPHYDDEDSETSPEDPQDNSNDHYLSDGTSSPLSLGKKFVQSNSSHSQDDTAEDPDDYCKEVQCVEMEESSRHRTSESLALASDGHEGTSGLALLANTDVTGQEVMSNSVNRDRELGLMRNGFGYDAQVTTTVDMPSSRSLSLTRSWSCRAELMTGLSSPEKADRTPPNGFEKGFPGRPDSLGRKLPLLNFDAKTIRLSRNDSQSSFGSASVDAQGVSTGDEDVTSLHTFVTGLKEMAKLEYEKQLVQGQAQETGSIAEKFEKNVKDIGVDPILETEETPHWPQEFERQQRVILELWQTCHVSLVHRTYFFLLFKGERSDSIYMEVELRRLSYLKEAYSHGYQATVDSRTPTRASSIKALHREREVLSKLMQKRFSEEERKRLFQQWGIALDSKRRRLQLADRLWSNTKDMNHVRASAAIVAKLIKFVDQGQALKEMFGLSFTPPIIKRRSYSWRNSRASLL